MVTEHAKADHARAPAEKHVEPKPADVKVPKVDHVARIAELARSLNNVTPSGAQTVADKILRHVDAIQNPEKYEKDEAKKLKAEAELEAIRKKDREANKTPASEKAKV